MRAFGKWLYEWATVITGVATGALSLLPDMLTDLFNLLDVFGAVDLTQWGISPLTAARVTTVVAVTKGVHAYYRHRCDKAAS